jgi:hypothetical protein
MGSSGRESFCTVEGACARQDRDRLRSLVLARLEEAPRPDNSLSLPRKVPIGPITHPTELLLGLDKPLW